MPAICRCGAELIWDPAYGFVCIKCGAKPWRCFCRQPLEALGETLEDVVKGDEI